MLGWLTFLTRMVGLPAYIRFFGVVGSISGPVILEGSGLPLGQRRMVCWARAGVARIVRARRTRRERMADMLMHVSCRTGPLRLPPHKRRPVCGDPDSGSHFVTRRPVWVM